MKIIISDLDGTLLNSQNKVGKEDYETLIKMGKSGIIRILATGRSLFSVQKVINDDFPADFLIFSTGAGIMDFKTKKIIKSYFLSKSETIKIVKNLLDLKIDFQVREKEPNGHKYHFKRFFSSNPDFDALEITYKEHITELFSIDDLRESSRIISISPNDGIEQRIRDKFLNYSIIRATSPIDNRSIWIEIFPKHVNKGTAVKYVCNLLNISLEHTIGIGNDYNDIDFLDITKQSFFVSNTCHELKTKYLLTKSNNENPISDICKTLNIIG